MSLLISHNGDDWHGTFGVILQTLLDDLLPEGPINVRVTSEFNSGTLVTEGKAVRVTDDGQLYVEQIPMPCLVLLDEILSLEVT